MEKRQLCDTFRSRNMLQNEFLFFAKIGLSQERAFRSFFHFGVLNIVRGHLIRFAPGVGGEVRFFWPQLMSKRRVFGV